MKHSIQIEAQHSPANRYESYCATNAFWTPLASLRFV
jgi:hypothetical protein